MKSSLIIAALTFSLLALLGACGGTAAPEHAGPVPTATATLSPAQALQEDIPLTPFIAMARANEIREIQVDGKKLTVYPKTIGRVGADRFVSRIGDDTGVIGLLIDSEVEVGPPRPRSHFNLQTKSRAKSYSQTNATG